MSDSRTIRKDDVRRRPRLEIPCHRCSGHGTVSSPMVLAVLDHPIKGGPASGIPTVVVGSMSIFEVTREASDIAKDNARPVVFDFNGQIVVVNADDDPEEVGRAWWRHAYNETPEETAARR